MSDMFDEEDAMIEAMIRDAQIEEYYQRMKSLTHWTTQGGNTIPIITMEDGHLWNTIALLERSDMTTMPVYHALCRERDIRDLLRAQNRPIQVSKTISQRIQKLKEDMKVEH